MIRTFSYLAGEIALWIEWSIFSVERRNPKPAPLRVRIGKNFQGLVPVNRRGAGARGEDALNSLSSIRDLIEERKKIEIFAGILARN